LFVEGTIPFMTGQAHPIKNETPWGGPRGKGGYYEKLMEVNFSFIYPEQLVN
jgi:hypothetical protein